jgi:hypothetical protein
VTRPGSTPAIAMKRAAIVSELGVKVLTIARAGFSEWLVQTAEGQAGITRLAGLTAAFGNRARYDAVGATTAISTGAA